MFSPSLNLPGGNLLPPLQRWTMEPLPGASHQVELEGGVMVDMTPMAGPMDPLVLPPASQGQNLCKMAGEMEKI